MCDDALDNNCDGSVDEGCNCNSGETRECGSVVAECKKGTQVCESGRWNKCVFSSAYYPKAEYLLDDKDNDCDGSIDEGFNCGIKYKVGFNRKCGQSNIAP